MTHLRTVTRVAWAITMRCARFVWHHRLVPIALWDVGDFARRNVSTLDFFGSLLVFALGVALRLSLGDALIAAGVLLLVPHVLLMVVRRAR